MYELWLIPVSMLVGGGLAVIGAVIAVKIMDR